MSIHSSTPSDGYPFHVRVTIAGIDCYSVGAENEMEATALKAQLESAEGVQDAEVVRS